MKTICFILVSVCLAAASFAEEEGRRAGLNGEEIAKLVKDELRLLDAASDQLAIEEKLSAGTAIPLAKLRPFLRPDTRLNLSFSESAGFTDLLGNSYGALAVDELPRVPAATFKALQKFAPAAFWKPYSPE
jgi:hypothetical protein